MVQRSQRFVEVLTDKCILGFGYYLNDDKTVCHMGVASHAVRGAYNDGERSRQASLSAAEWGAFNFNSRNLDEIRRQGLQRHHGKDHDRR